MDILPVLFDLYRTLLTTVQSSYRRSHMLIIDQTAPSALAIIGERGVGKTYMLLQYCAQQTTPTLYFSADNSIISSLFDIVYQAYKVYGIRIIVIDEVHRAPGWARDLKSIIDSFPDCRVIVSGSSALDLYHGTADLARRIYQYYLPTLSFGEYCQLYHQVNLPVLSCEQLLSDAGSLSVKISSMFDMQWFRDYCQRGYYPFGLQLPTPIFHQLIRQNLKKVIWEDLPTFTNHTYETASKIEKLFYYIASTPPSLLSYASIAKTLQVSISFVESCIMYLSSIGVVSTVIRSNKITDIMRKEMKVFLGNPTQYYALGQGDNTGTIRECFVLHALRHYVHLGLDDIVMQQYGDMTIKIGNKRYTLEIGGKSKGRKQLGDTGGYVVRDDVMIGDAHTIPLWMFGLLEG